MADKLYMNDIFLRFPNGVDKACSFSYDDGTLSDRKLVEIFNRYGLKGTFNINSGWLSETEENARLKGSELKELFTEAGHEVALHGHTHPFLDILPNGIAAYEMIRNREILENLLGMPVKGMAYPNGPVTAEKAYDDRMIELLNNCGICYARTTESTKDFLLPKEWLRMPPTCHHNDPDLMKIAYRFAETKVDRLPRLFLVWGHSVEFENQKNWNVIEELAKYLATRKDIWFATNMEIYRYVQAYQRLEFGVNGEVVYNPSGQTVYFMKNFKNYLVMPNEVKQIK